VTDTFFGKCAGCICAAIATQSWETRYLFFDMGVQRLPPALLIEKQPEFSVIAPSSLERARHFRPTFILSRKTLAHVPPSELGAFLSQACALMTPETICVHEMPPTMQGSHQFNKYSWIYSLDDIGTALPNGFCVGYREDAFVVRAPAAK
jgi:hypothetical protein